MTKWTRADDKRLRRLIGYMKRSRKFHLRGYVGDSLENCQLHLYVDADFCGEIEHTKSNSGMFLVMVGPNTWFPLAWQSKRQSSTARSTTEAELISLAKAFFPHAIPMLNLFDILIAHTGKKMHLVIHEDNQATIKVIENGWSAKLAHVGRVHKIDIGSVHEQICKNLERYVSLEYCETLKMVADIFTKALAPAKWPHALNLLHMIHDFNEKPGKEDPIETEVTDHKKACAAHPHSTYEATCGDACAESIVEDIVHDMKSLFPDAEVAEVRKACTATIKLQSTKNKKNISLHK